ncbi:MAG: NADH-quinone oxidoreductase subunit M [Planctomycetota bacterium]
MFLLAPVSLLIFLPLVGAVAIAALPERRERQAPWVALGVSLFALLIMLVLAGGLPGAMQDARAAAHADAGRADAYGAEAKDGPDSESESAAAWAVVGEVDRPWLAAGTWAEDNGIRELVSGLRLSYHVGFDAISLPLAVLTGVLVPLSVLASFSGIRTRIREYYAWLLALAGGLFGVFAARDLLLFYVFFEFTLVPLYFLIGIWGGPQRRYAANKFFLYTFVGSMITFAGILYLGVRATQITGSGIVDFDLRLLSSLLVSGGGAATSADAAAQYGGAAAGLTVAEQSLLFLAFFAGFAIKVPFWPLHTWLPLAHTEAPTAGSVLLAGVLLKLGTYGFLRFTLPVVPAGAVAWAGVMGVLAVAGVLYGALCCWVQRDVKKLVAYSSVSHLGFCMLGMFSLVPIGLSGSVLYMVNHGISTGALFLVVGMLYERYHTRDLNELSGIARRMPILAFFFVLFVLSSIGLPGLNGFISEFTVLFAAFNSDRLGPWFGALGTFGIVLGAIYMLYAVGKILFGPLREPAGTPGLSGGLRQDLNAREIAILTPLAVLVVLLGVAPRIITDPLDPALRGQILTRVHLAYAAPTPGMPSGMPSPDVAPARADQSPSGSEGPPDSAPPAQAADDLILGLARLRAPESAHVDPLSAIVSDLKEPHEATAARPILHSAFDNPALRGARP